MEFFLFAGRFGDILDDEDITVDRSVGFDDGASVTFDLNGTPVVGREVSLPGDKAEIVRDTFVYLDFVPESILDLFGDVRVFEEVDSGSHDLIAVGSEDACIGFAHIEQFAVRGVDFYAYG